MKNGMNSAMKAMSMPRRTLRFSRAERMVASSRLATASRKPKSRDSRLASPCSWLARRAHSWSNTAPEATSSCRTTPRALAAIEA